MELVFFNKILQWETGREGEKEENIKHNNIDKWFKKWESMRKRKLWKNLKRDFDDKRNSIPNGICLKFIKTSNFILKHMLQIFNWTILCKTIWQFVGRINFFLFCFLNNTNKLLWSKKTKQQIKNNVVVQGINT